MVEGERRKRRRILRDEECESGSASFTHELFRKHFETTFKPLPEVVRAATPNDQESSGDVREDEPDWCGLSDEEQVEEIATTQDAMKVAYDISRAEQRAFMSTKAPKYSNLLSAEQDIPHTQDDHIQLEATNLKNDLALQRLLKESHLLEPHSTLSHTGRSRHKATDLRLRDLGSKSSIFYQQNMPLAQRKGIHAKMTERESIRRREAVENGIVLEKFKSNKKDNKVRRQRGIGAPSVGKFKGGTLTLSKKDVAEIQGRKRTAHSRR